MKKPVFFASFLMVLGCSSGGSTTDSPSPVLEPVEAAAEASETPIESPVPAAYEAVRSKLSELGYEGVGLDLETVESLERLQVVFSDPGAANRRIKQIYTGAANDYDANTESVTLSGTSDAQAILTFLKKRVPLRGAPPPKPVRRAKPGAKAKPK